MPRVRADDYDTKYQSILDSAAALFESGNLMLMGSRAVDKGDWVRMSRAMIESGQTVLKAVQAKNAAGVLAAGEAVNTSCDNCHRRYQRA